MTKKQEYNPNMRGAIWTESRVTTVHDPKTDKPKIVSPAFSGKIMVHGETFTIRLWPVTSDNPKAPAYSIAVSEAKSASASKEA
jgi:hypothetical protein